MSPKNHKPPPWDNPTRMRREMDAIYALAEGIDRRIERIRKARRILGICTSPTWCDGTGNDCWSCWY